MKEGQTGKVQRKKRKARRAGKKAGPSGTRAYRRSAENSRIAVHFDILTVHSVPDELEYNNIENLHMNTSNSILK